MNSGVLPSIDSSDQGFLNRTNRACSQDSVPLGKLNATHSVSVMLLGSYNDVMNSSNLLWLNHQLPHDKFPFLRAPKQIGNIHDAIGYGVAVTSATLSSGCSQARGSTPRIRVIFHSVSFGVLCSVISGVFCLFFFWWASVLAQGQLRDPPLPRYSKSLPLQKS